jgi:hypothetical protein
MTFGDISPLVIVISRDQVERNDIKSPLDPLKWLISKSEITRKFRTQVDVAFDGYNEVRWELSEIPEVRNYVYALDEQFPFWLYFLSREMLGLQCLAYCFLPPYLTDEARKEIHPKRLADLIDNRWGPALIKVCSSAGHTQAEADELLQSALAYFTAGPKHFRSLPDANA